MRTWNKRAVYNRCRNSSFLDDQLHSNDIVDDGHIPTDETLPMGLATPLYGICTHAFPLDKTNKYIWNMWHFIMLGAFFQSMIWWNYFIQF